MTTRVRATLVLTSLGVFSTAIYSFRVFFFCATIRQFSDKPEVRNVFGIYAIALLGYTLIAISSTLWMLIVCLRHGDPHIDPGE